MGKLSLLTNLLVKRSVLALVVICAFGATLNHVITDSFADEPWYIQNDPAHFGYSADEAEASCPKYQKEGADCADWISVPHPRCTADALSGAPAADIPATDAPAALCHRHHHRRLTPHHVARTRRATTSPHHAALPRRATTSRHHATVFRWQSASSCSRTAWSPPRCT